MSKTTRKRSRLCELAHQEYATQITELKQFAEHTFSDLKWGRVLVYDVDFFSCIGGIIFLRIFPKRNVMNLGLSYQFMATGRRNTLLYTETSKSVAKWPDNGYWQRRKDFVVRVTAFPFNTPSGNILKRVEYLRQHASNKQLRFCGEDCEPGTSFKRWADFELDEG